MIKNYGVDNISKVFYIRENRSDMMRINTDNYNLIIRNKYGVDNISELDWIKDKKIATTKKNWGVDNPSQNPDLFEKSQISGKKLKLHENTQLFYRGTYEKDFLDFCFNNHIQIKKGLTIKYTINNKSKVYHSDFFISKYNLIIEIKSSYYYLLYESINLLKKEACINQGYNYIAIIDKDYEELSQYLHSHISK
jgi:hypothetical protein